MRLLSEVLTYFFKTARKLLTLISSSFTTSLRILFLRGEDSVNNIQKRKFMERLTDDLPKMKLYSFGEIIVTNKWIKIAR